MLNPYVQIMCAKKEIFGKFKYHFTFAMPNVKYKDYPTQGFHILSICYNNKKRKEIVNVCKIN